MCDWQILLVILITLGNLIGVIEESKKPTEMFCGLVLLAWAWYSVGHAVAL